MGSEPEEGMILAVLGSLQRVRLPPRVWRSYAGSRAVIEASSTWSGCLARRKDPDPTFLEGAAAYGGSA